MSELMDYLQGRGVTFTVIPQGRAAPVTGEEPPMSLPQDEMVRTVVVIANYGPVLMVVPASRTLDMKLAAVATRDIRVRLATERELEQTFPDYEPGALPPISMMLLAPMYVDPAIMARDQVVFAAGRKDVSIRMATEDLFGTDPVVITPLTAESNIEPAANPS